MSETLAEMLERNGITTETLKAGMDESMKRWKSVVNEMSEALESGPHPQPLPISNNGNGEGSTAGYKPGDRVFDFVHFLNQDDLDRAFEKLSEQDKVTLDELALEIVTGRKGADAHKQFSTRMAFEFLAMVGIRMLNPLEFSLPNPFQITAMGKRKAGRMRSPFPPGKHQGSDRKPPRPTPETPAMQTSATTRVSGIADPLKISSRDKCGDRKPPRLNPFGKDVIG